MLIPRETVDAIFRAADLVEVIGEYVALRRRGQSWVGLSPFKRERSPSFYVTPSKGIWKCFATGKGGNVASFLMELEGLSYREALLKLAQKYSIEVRTEASDEARATADQQESLRILNNYALKWFRERLAESETAQAYLMGRGLQPETIEAWELGYAPDGWEALTQAALKAQYRQDYLLLTGLSKQREGQPERIYDAFRDRVMFPIRDTGGQVVGFGGRILKADERAAKYLNSPDSPVYHKSRVVYGLYQARQAIRQAKQAIVVEGYLDVISLHQAGVRNVVAVSGTSLTEDQLRQVGRFSTNVLLLFDDDAAGRAATLRAIDLALAAGLAVEVCNLPGGHDPDSYVQAHGVTLFQSYLREHAQDFLDYQLRALPAGRDASDPQVRTEVIRTVARSVAHIADELQRDVYSQQAAQRLGLPDRTFLNAVNQAVLALRTLQQRQQQAEARQRERDQQQTAARGPSRNAPPPQAKARTGPAAVPPDMPPPPDYTEFEEFGRVVAPSSPPPEPPLYFGELAPAPLDMPPPPDWATPVPREMRDWGDSNFGLDAPDDLYARPAQLAQAAQLTWFQERELVRLMLSHLNETIEIPDPEAEASIDEGGQKPTLTVPILDVLYVELREVQFAVKGFDTIRQTLLDRYEQGEELHRDSLLAELDPETQETLAELLADRFEPSERWLERNQVFVPRLDAELDRAVLNAARHYKLRCIRLLIQENHERLRTAFEDAEVDLLLKAQIHLYTLREVLTKALGIVAYTGGHEGEH